MNRRARQTQGELREARLLCRVQTGIFAVDKFPVAVNP